MDIKYDLGFCLSLMLVLALLLQKISCQVTEISNNSSGQAIQGLINDGSQRDREKDSSLASIIEKCHTSSISDCNVDDAVNENGTIYLYSSDEQIELNLVPLNLTFKMHDFVTIECIDDSTTGNGKPPFLVTAIQMNISNFGFINCPYGVFELAGAGAKFSNSSFINNGGKSQFPGGVFRAHPSNKGILLTNSTFIGNRALSGGVYWGQTPVEFIAEYCHFENNSAIEHGGVVSVSAGDYQQDSESIEQFSFCILKSNRARFGGVSSLYGTTGNVARLKLLDVEAFDNKAVHGGIAWVRESSEPTDTQEIVSLTRSSLHHNYALLNGGVLDANTFGFIVVNYSNIAKNEALNGGALHISTANVTFNFTEVNGNTARQDGGGILLASGVAVNVLDSSFSENYAGKSGGAMCILCRIDFDTDLKLPVHFKNVSFDSNTAGVQGGGFSAQKSTFTMSSGYPFIFRDNRAGTNLSLGTAGDGGAMYIGNEATVVFTNFLAQDNYASRSGGFFFASKGSFVFLASALLISNVAFIGGSAFGAKADSSVSLVNIEILRNKCIFDGGAISIQTTDGLTPAINMEGVTLEGNHGPRNLTVYVLTSCNIIQSVNDSSFTLDVPMTALSATARVQCIDCKLLDSVVFGGSPATSSLHIGLDNSQEGTCLTVLNEEFSNGKYSDPVNRFPNTRSNGLIQLSSGSRLPSICIVLRDVFGKPSRLLPETPLNYNFAVGSHHEDSFELVMPMTTSIPVSFDAFIDNVIAYGLLGTFDVSIFPLPSITQLSQGFESSAFSHNLSVEVVNCAEGEILTKNSESEFNSCQNASDFTYPGWFIADRNDYTSSAICPAGTQRPAGWNALMCHPCPEGTVSVLNRSRCDECPAISTMTWNSSLEKCEPCPDGANCFGGNRVFPKLGYFHSSIRSYKFQPCLTRDVCVFPNRTGFIEDALNDILDASLDPSRKLAQADSATDFYQYSQCAEGYTSYLCGACEVGYQRKSATTCSKCESLKINIVKFVVPFVILLCFILYTIRRTFDQRNKSTLSIKISVGFIQMLSTLGGFRIGWTEPVFWLIDIAKLLSSGGFDSLDCLLESLGLTGIAYKAAISIYGLPLIFGLLVPFVVFMVAPDMFWSLKPISSNIFAIAMVIYFFLHVFITSETLNLFSCIAVYDSPESDWRSLQVYHKYLFMDTRYQCFQSGEHFLAAMAVGIPSLTVFVIGMPMTFTYLLYKSFSKIENSEGDSSYGFLRLGLSKYCCWWVFLLMFRVSVLAVLGSFLESPGMQNLTAQLWLVFYLILLLYLRPYEIGNIIEMDSITVLSVLALLHINLWMIFTKEKMPYDFMSYLPIFSSFLIIAICICVCFLCLQNVYIIVASSKGVDPKLIGARETVIVVYEWTQKKLRFQARGQGPAVETVVADAEQV